MRPKELAERWVELFNAADATDSPRFHPAAARKAMALLGSTLQRAAQAGRIPSNRVEARVRAPRRSR